ncbi:MAG: hypothetical protein IT196_19305, partial [Acidimicrobiales bacterium]|nr:hypothetical protein [Acidimicrobiales bacterium]
MSLRWRLSLALAALAALATVVTASVAYASTRARIDAEIDRLLEERADTIVAMWHTTGGRRSPGPGAGAALGRADLLAPDTLVQLLDRDGDISGRNGEVELPVDATDRAVAGGAASSRAGERTRLRTVRVGDTGYRVATRALEPAGALQAARDLTERDRVLAGLQRRFALLGAAVVAVAAGVGFVIARRATGALEALAASAERVAATGDLGLPVPVGGGAE